MSRPREKHGMSGTPEYWAWRDMKKRCLNPHSHEFINYGGRGIRVCDRWLNSFAAFLVDVGRRPSPKHSIDRIENDGNYEPGNCRWATVREQLANRRTTSWVTFRGETKTRSEWCAIQGITPLMFLRRTQAGWSVDEALSTPAGSRPTNLLLTFQGETKTLADWCRELGFKRSAIDYRLRTGWTVEDALSTPITTPFELARAARKK